MINPTINDYLKGLRMLHHILSRTDSLYHGDMWDIFRSAVGRVGWAIFEIIQKDKSRGSSSGSKGSPWCDCQAKLEKIRQEHVLLK